MTEAELLPLVQVRFSQLDATTQTAIAKAAHAVMAEPRWAKTGIQPIMAVKIAGHRVLHRRSF